jgi:biotin carboxylase
MKVAVVVDPYSSGQYLVQELKSRHWAVVAIQSTLDLADFWTAQFNPDLYVDYTVHKNLPRTLQFLSKFDVQCVLAGSEPGVMLAEDLQTELGLPCNGSETKIWRRNKYDMSERLREVGLRAVRQIYSNDIDEILEWQKEWGKWPIIVKPAMSGGTDGVYWCHSEDDVKEAVDKEMGKLNCNGQVNDKLLAQEFLDGTEYIVDCVSYEGRHVLNGIWVYRKDRDTANKSVCPEYSRLLESHGEIQDQLIEYTFKCLSALNINYGPSHTEVMMVEDGPCMVETGARLHGLKGPKMAELATGLGQHELTVDVAVGGANLFNQLQATNYRYILKKYCIQGMLRNQLASGILARDLSNCEELKALPSFYEIFPSVKPGETLPITRDLQSSPGVFLQMYADEEQCFQDFEALRKLEATILYKVHDDKDEWMGETRRSHCMSPLLMSPSRAHRSYTIDEPEFEFSGFDLDEVTSPGSSISSD